MLYLHWRFAGAGCVRCVICGRVTLKPALVVAQGAIGPDCAAKRGLLPPKGKGYTRPLKRTTATIQPQGGLFDGDAEAKEVQGLQG